MSDIILKTPISDAGVTNAALPSGGVVRGQVVTIGNATGFALADVPEVAAIAGETQVNPEQRFSFVYEAEQVSGPKDASVVTGMEKAYWDVTTDPENPVLTTTAGTNVPVGYFDGPAAGSATRANVIWRGLN